MQKGRYVRPSFVQRESRCIRQIRKADFVFPSDALEGLSEMTALRELRKWVKEKGDFSKKERGGLLSAATRMGKKRVVGWLIGRGARGDDDCQFGGSLYEAVLREDWVTAERLAKVGGVIKSGEALSLLLNKMGSDEKAHDALLFLNGKIEMGAVNDESKSGPLFSVLKMGWVSTAELLLDGIEKEERFNLLKRLRSEIAEETSASFSIVEAYLLASEVEKRDSKSRKKL